MNSIRPWSAVTNDEESQVFPQIYSGHLLCKPIRNSRKIFSWSNFFCCFSLRPTKCHEKNKYNTVTTPTRLQNDLQNSKQMQKETLLTEHAEQISFSEETESADSIISSDNETRTESSVTTHNDTEEHNFSDWFAKENFSWLDLSIVPAKAKSCCDLGSIMNENLRLHKKKRTRSEDLCRISSNLSINCHPTWDEASSCSMSESAEQDLNKLVLKALKQDYNSSSK